MQQTTLKNINFNNPFCKPRDSTHYCAYDPREIRSNVCIGDSGNPLMYWINDRWYVYGITVYNYAGTYCISQNNPSFYTKVPEYLNWIATTMAQN